ncbi:MAG: hypothetical protein C4520_13755 [Candidatus Abyssobacteria bacterium SURF_5]|uniref:Glycoside hydrolase family 57 N-terminal domain-containing protein n=1 Tax=Abyssobacteria bacterium (strain SURF_5) TaxID=2093360 RepID=A0A3A4NNZ4_ABYX5|nr:MAG: hypothetical protein C4520_13755 [Candidatus Abyssubacteria bacterium SURF_5]
MKADPKIFLAFRFHVNFYHSYRGDTPDEFGFGPDIRIIRNTIKVLDDFNSRGIPVCGSWDIENYFSLETIMPAHCPDIIESWKRRVAEGKDEIQVMSFNNGLISAHTAAEFDEAIGRAITNSRHSGLRDLFSEFAPMVRPQEMMYTPIHLKMYPRHGVSSISLFYSAVPFNSFSNFISPLPLEQRFNPLILSYPGINETMTLLPACNHGDIVDNISLRRWVSRLRQQQCELAQPMDFLLLIDADADDEFWYGYNWPLVRALFSTAGGLDGLVRSVADLEYVGFTTPGRYVESHLPVGEITIGQDTADGSFDGFSSWAEKWSNHQVWTGVERSRVLEFQVRRLLEFVKRKDDRKEIETLLSEALENRLKCMSTTHFGLSSPVMNVSRLRAGAKLALASVRAASRAFDIAAEAALRKSRRKEKETAAEFSLIDYVRGVSTKTVTYKAKPSRALMRVKLALPGGATAAQLLSSSGNECPCALLALRERESPATHDLIFLDQMDGKERKDFHLSFSSSPEYMHPWTPASLKGNDLQNEFLALSMDKRLHPTSLRLGDLEFSSGTFLRSAVTYADQTVEASAWRLVESAVLAKGLIAFARAVAEFPIAAAQSVRIERELLMAAGLPYLYINVRIQYPPTKSDNYSKRKARKLQTRYDNNWREVIPCELRPALLGRAETPLRIWKHNYCGHISHYKLNYGEFSRNSSIDSFNNHITNAWVAVSDGKKGLLVAQSADVNSSFAFCPMRTRAGSGGTTRIFLNPFGSYYGKQLNYATAHSGLGRYMAVKMADHLDPSAPSYNGRTEKFSLMIAPYEGDAPPEQILHDAEAFAYPYAVVSRSEIICPPAHRDWTFGGEAQEWGR